MHKDNKELIVPYKLLDKQKEWIKLFDDDLPPRRALLASRWKGKSEIVTTLGSAWKIWTNPGAKIGILCRDITRAAELVSKAADILQALGMNLRKQKWDYFSPENTAATPSLKPFGLDSNLRGYHFDFF